MELVGEGSGVAGDVGWGDVEFVEQQSQGLGVGQSFWAWRRVVL